MLDAMEFAQCTPSLFQALRIKKLSADGKLTVRDMEDILSEIKQKEIDRVVFKTEQLLEQNRELFSDCGPFCMNGGCEKGKMTCGKSIPPQMLPTDIIRVDFPKLCEESVLEEGVLDEDTAD